PLPRVCRLFSHRGPAKRRGEGAFFPLREPPQRRSTLSRWHSFRSSLSLGTVSRRFPVQREFLPWKNLQSISPQGGGRRDRKSQRPLPHFRRTGAALRRACSKAA